MRLNQRAITAVRDEQTRLLAADPSAFGFEPIGWAVRLSAGYVREWAILRPSAGVYQTTKECEALVWDERRHAAWMARKTGGEVAEVWESPTDRLICWGDHIPPQRREARASDLVADHDKKPKRSA